MSNDQKTAIQQAEKQLEQERKERLKNEVYQYLKQELESIDSINEKVRRLSEERRAHEENIKNIKQGNLKAIEQRRKSFEWVHVPYIPQWPYSDTISVYTSGSGSAFYSNSVAGSTITTSSGNTYVF